MLMHHLFFQRKKISKISDAFFPRALNKLYPFYKLACKKINILNDIYLTEKSRKKLIQNK